MNYEAKCKIDWIHNADDSHTRTDYISQIHFWSNTFNINFCPRGYDYNNIKTFLTEFILGNDCKLVLFDETGIEFIVENNNVTVKLDWSTRPGTLTYTSPKNDWVDVFKRLNDDLVTHKFFRT